MAKRDGAVVKKRASATTVTAPAARPMKVIVDESGCPWLCDADVDPLGDLKAQGCWRYTETAAKRN